MIDVSNVPPELMERVRGMFLTLFGGKENLDCWLTRIADELADAGNPANRPIRLDPSMIPAEFQSWMHRPKEVVDHLLEQLESLAIFGYAAKIIKQGETSLAIVSDQASGHVIEEATGPDPDSLIHSLVEKYGQNLEVMKE
jgi:hypothetical protein